jgi:hypothetical protein
MLKATGTKTKNNGAAALSEGHWKQVSEEAYYLAEKRGFQAAGDLADGYNAETMIGIGAANEPKAQ